MDIMNIMNNVNALSLLEKINIIEYEMNSLVNFINTLPIQSNTDNNLIRGMQDGINRTSKYIAALKEANINQGNLDYHTPQNYGHDVEIISIVQSIIDINKKGFFSGLDINLRQHEINDFLMEFYTKYLQDDSLKNIRFRIMILNNRIDNYLKSSGWGNIIINITEVGIEQGQYLNYCIHITQNGIPNTLGFNTAPLSAYAQPSSYHSVLNSRVGISDDEDVKDSYSDLIAAIKDFSTSINMPGIIINGNNLDALLVKYVSSKSYNDLNVKIRLINDIFLKQGEHIVISNIEDTVVNVTEIYTNSIRINYNGFLINRHISIGNGRVLNCNKDIANLNTLLQNTLSRDNSHRRAILNTLSSVGINTYGDVVNTTPAELLKIKGIGITTIDRLHIDLYKLTYIKWK